MGTEYDGPACYAEALLFNWWARLSLELLLCMCSDTAQEISLPSPEQGQWATCGLETPQSCLLPSMFKKELEFGLVVGWKWEP